MNHKILFIPLASIILTGCVSFLPKKEESREDKTIQEIHHEYDEISDIKIFWSDIFKQSDNEYYIYLYSTTCSHCNSIKDEMIEFALNSTTPIYFIQSSSEHNIAELGTINVKELSSLYIRGYPTLLKVTNKEVILNIAGVAPIKAELHLK